MHTSAQEFLPLVYVCVVCCFCRPVQRIHISHLRTWVRSVQSSAVLTTHHVGKLFFAALCHPVSTSSSLQQLNPINRESFSSESWQSTATPPGEWFSFFVVSHALSLNGFWPLVLMFVNMIILIWVCSFSSRSHTAIPQDISSIREVGLKWNQFKK